MGGFQVGDMVKSKDGRTGTVKYVGGKETALTVDWDDGSMTRLTPAQAKQLSLQKIESVQCFNEDVDKVNVMGLPLIEEESDYETEVVNDLTSAFADGKEGEELEELRKEIEDSLDLKHGRYSNWGKSGSFTADGDEYNFIESEDDAVQIATDIVKENLENEPETFNRDWLSNHMTVSDARYIAMDMADSYIEGMDEEDLVKEAGMEDEYEEAKEAGEDTDKIVDAAKDEVQSDTADKYEKEIERDPIQFFVHDHGLYSEEELMKQKFMQVDVETAADDAIGVDGWAHFLSLYDGNYDETKGGRVYFRE